MIQKISTIINHNHNKKLHIKNKILFKVKIKEQNINVIHVKEILTDNEEIKHNRVTINNKNKIIVRIKDDNRQYNRVNYIQGETDLNKKIELKVILNKNKFKIIKPRTFIIYLKNSSDEEKIHNTIVVVNKIISNKIKMEYNGYEKDRLLITNVNKENTHMNVSVNLNNKIKNNNHFDIYSNIKHIKNDNLIIFNDNDYYTSSDVKMTRCLNDKIYDTSSYNSYLKIEPFNLDIVISDNLKYISKLTFRIYVNIKKWRDLLKAYESWEEVLMLNERWRDIINIIELEKWEDLIKYYDTWNLILESYEQWEDLIAGRNNMIIINDFSFYKSSLLVKRLSPLWIKCNSLFNDILNNTTGLSNNIYEFYYSVDVINAIIKNIKINTWEELKNKYDNWKTVLDTYMTWREVAGEELNKLQIENITFFDFEIIKELLSLMEIVTMSSTIKDKITCKLFTKVKMTNTNKQFCNANSFLIINNALLNDSMCESKMNLEIKQMEKPTWKGIQEKFKTWSDILNNIDTWEKLKIYK